MACVAGAGMTSLGRRTSGPHYPPGHFNWAHRCRDDKASPMIGRILQLMREARGHLRPQIWDSDLRQRGLMYRRGSALFRLVYPVLCSDPHHLLQIYLPGNNKRYYQTTDCGVPR